MAGVNRVEFGNEVLVDLSQDTVTANSLRTGFTAHDAKGDRIVGVGGAITSGINDDASSQSDTDVLWSAGKTRKEIDEIGNTIASLYKKVYKNELDPDKAIVGIYERGTKTYIYNTNGMCYPPFRVYKGVSYRFARVYAYFCTIFYDDGTSQMLSDTTPSDQTVELTNLPDNGYAYITIAPSLKNYAMCVAGNSIYNDKFFEGFDSFLSLYPLSSINPNNYSEKLPTLADAKANSIYKIISTTVMTTNTGTMTDVPWELKMEQIVSVLITIGIPTSIPCFQVLITHKGNIYTRYWNNTPAKGLHLTEWTDGAITKNMKRQVLPNNYETLLPSLDNVTGLNGTIYTITSLPSMTTAHGGLWGRVPKELERSQCSSVLMTTGYPGVGEVQFLVIANHGKVYSRFYNGSSSGQVWTDWKAYGQQDVIVDINGNGDFTSFTEAMKYAVNYMNCHVYVRQGTYDIIQEYEDLYGSDFFTNYSSNTSDVGIVLCNNVVVEFSPNAYLVCDYQGDNEIFQNRFSPLNSGINGFTLINCHLTSHNVRYSMHDERASNTDYYHNKYLGCHFIHNDEGAGYTQAIGGGLGINGLIEIDNCIFETPGSQEGSASISWHNSRGDGARSQIFIRNSIIQRAIRFSWYGSSTLVSTMMITGCKMGASPIFSQETQDFNIRNVEIIEWNNVISNN